VNLQWSTRNAVSFGFNTSVGRVPPLVFLKKILLILTGLSDDNSTLSMTSPFPLMMVAFVPAPINVIALVTLSVVAQVSVPAGISTVSPSEEAEIAAVTAARVALAA
jgi:hypothetical protein